MVAIVLIAPFERVLWTMPAGVVVTTAEAAAALAVAMLALGGEWRAALRRLPATIVVPAAVFLIALAIAALVSPVDRGNAVRYAGRLLMAALVCLAAIRATASPGRTRAVVWTMVAVAVLVASIAVLEAAQVTAVMQALTAFRPGFHVVGGQLRATSTLGYPTIASMYLEVAFALGLWRLVEPSSGRPRLERALMFAALVVIGAGITATFTRAGLLAMAIAMALVGTLRLSRMPRRQAGLAPLTALAAVIGGVVLVSHSPALLATRFAVEGSGAWYGAAYDVPVSLQLRTGRVQYVPVTLTNTGRLTWSSSIEPPFSLSYHWLRAGSDRVVEFEGRRTPFPIPVASGDRVTFRAAVVAPGEPGAYTLVWDVVHEARAWLSTEGVAPARTAVTVAGPPVGAVTDAMDRLPPAVHRPARPALWRAALSMVREHPWLGVGPDNFRLTYGRYLGLPTWDRRVHTNNMYLEILVGAGLVGFVPFAWMLAAASRHLWRQVLYARGTGRLCPAVAVAVAVVIAGHGLVDAFLGFTSTYLTFAVAAALALTAGGDDAGASDAHRV